MFKEFSAHPKLVAVVDCIVNIAMVLFLKSVSSWAFVGVWLFFRVAVWALLIRFMYYPAELNRWKHLLSLSVFAVGILCFLIFIEWDVAWYLIAFIFVFFSFESFWLLPATKVNIAPFFKPHLRWRFIMSVIGLAGIFGGINAVISFQLMDINSWIWTGSAALLAALAAFWWWLEYGIEKNKRLLLWSLAFLGLMLELVWVVRLLPLGYLVSSMVLIWCWYVVWLMARFDLTPEGINWKKQTWFLAVNLALFILLLLFAARWK